MVAQGPLQQAEVDDVLPLGDADPVAEGADALRGEAATAQSGNGGHSGVVPPVHDAVLHQGQEFPLGHDRVVEVEAGKFNLSAREDAELLDEPLVQGAVDFEFQRAQAVGDVFDGVTLTVGEIVHRIEAPIVSGSVVVGPLDAVEQRVPHVHVGVRHVDFGAQHAMAIGMDAVPHFLEEAQVLLYRTVAVGAVGSGRGGRPLLRGHLLGGLMIHVGLAELDEFDGKAIELFEMVAGVELTAIPVISEPRHIPTDGVHVFLVLLFGIGVVEAEVDEALVFLGEPEGEADGLGVPDVQVSIGLRRESRVDALVLARLQVVGDDLLDEMQGGSFLLFLGRRRVLFGHGANLSSPESQWSLHSVISC